MIQKWYYGLYRRLALIDIRSVSLSQLADDYVCFHILNQHDFLFTCRRKTELLCILLRQKNIPVSFTNTFSMTMKTKKKKKAVMNAVTLNFQKGSGSSEPQPGAQKNAWTITIPPGESPETQPVIEVKKVAVQKQGMAQRQSRGGGGGMRQSQMRGAPPGGPPPGQRQSQMRGAPPSGRGAPNRQSQMRGAPPARGAGGPPRASPRGSRQF
jgi:hypothetical protein